MTNNNLTQTLSRFINNTNQNIFLTGKAGTGKTTFLRNICKHTHKNVIVAAPTGIAAINAGGVTLHSLFQLPFGAFMPDNNGINAQVNTEINTPRTLLKSLQMHKNKRNMLQKMELLVIDEVSMLRADLLDAIDLVLRSVRREREKPFGGVQVLFIGDLLQLPPVVKDQEARLLAPYYPGFFFFQSQVVRQYPPLYIELEKVYRQNDASFITLLNHFRDNQVTEQDIEFLNQYYKPNFVQGADSGVVLLTTHNRIVDHKNKATLNSLSGKSYKYEAQVSGEFKSYNYPADEVLEFKKGAQVMFTKNDNSEEHRFYNGKIGFISALAKDKIEVDFRDGTEPVEVEPFEWDNKKYSVDSETNEIEESVVGRFVQYPLKLAWAITVHKSQGLTFDKAILDVENAFAPGQIYVALSRLRSLDGLILTSQIPREGINIDDKLKSFSGTKKKQEELTPILEEEAKKYLNNFILNTFDFSDVMGILRSHYGTYTKDAKRSVKQGYKAWAGNLIEETEPLVKVAASFRAQVHKIIYGQQDFLAFLKERVDKSAVYFEPFLKGLYEKVKKHHAEVKGVKGSKTYCTELIEVANLYLGLLQKISKSQVLIQSAIDGTQVEKSSIPQPEMERISTATAKRKKSEKANKPKGGGAVKVSTKDTSFAMYKSGKSIEQIAKERSLVATTIQSHLSYFVQTGELDVKEFVNNDKINLIEKEIHKQDTFTLTPIKEALGNEVTFGEIKMVVAYMQSQGVVKE